jgi:hypothetical protein
MIDLQDEALKIIEDLTREAVGYFEKAIEAKGLILTSELRNNFRYDVVAGAGGLLASATIYFEGYGRILDMKKLRYSTVANLDAMEAFVEKIGVDKFPYVPGYTDKTRVPTVNQAVKRIAAGIAWQRYKIGTVNQGKTKAWYTRTLNDFVNVSRRRISEILATHVAQSVKFGLGGM